MKDDLTQAEVSEEMIAGIRKSLADEVRQLRKDIKRPGTELRKDDITNLIKEVKKTIETLKEGMSRPEFGESLKRGAQQEIQQVKKEQQRKPQTLQERRAAMSPEEIQNLKDKGLWREESTMVEDDGSYDAVKKAMAPKWIPKGKDGKKALSYKKRSDPKKVSGKQKTLTEEVKSADEKIEAAKDKKSTGLVDKAINALHKTILRLLGKIETNTRKDKTKKGTPATPVPGALVESEAKKKQRKGKKQKKPQQADEQQQGLWGDVYDVVQDEVDPITGLAMQIGKHQITRFKEKRAAKKGQQAATPAPTSSEPESKVTFRDQKVTSNLITDGPQQASAGNDGGGFFSNMIGGAASLASGVMDFMRGGKKTPDVKKPEVDKNGRKMPERDEKGRFKKSPPKPTPKPSAGGNMMKLLGRGARAIGPAGAVLGAAYTGYEVGQMINESSWGDSLGLSSKASEEGRSLGSKAFDFFNKDDDPDGAKAIAKAKADALERQQKRADEAKAKAATVTTGGSQNTTNNNVSSPQQSAGESKIITRNTESSYRRYIDSRVKFA